MIALVRFLQVTLAATCIGAVACLLTGHVAAAIACGALWLSLSVIGGLALAAIGAAIDELR